MNYAPAVFGVKIIRHAGSDISILPPDSSPPHAKWEFPTLPSRQIFTSFRLRERGFAHDVIPHQDAGRFEHVIGPRTRCACAGLERRRRFRPGPRPTSCNNRYYSRRANSTTIAFPRDHKRRRRITNWCRIRWKKEQRRFSSPPFRCCAAIAGESPRKNESSRRCSWKW